MTSSAKETEYSVPFESQPLLFVAVTSYKSGRLTRYSPKACACASKSAKRSLSVRPAKVWYRASSASVEPAQTILAAAGLRISQANLATRLTATLALSVSSVAPRVDARARPKPQPLRRVCAAFSEPSRCLCVRLLDGVECSGHGRDVVAVTASMAWKG